VPGAVYELAVDADRMRRRCVDDDVHAIVAQAFDPHHSSLGRCRPRSERGGFGSRESVSQHALIVPRGIVERDIDAVASLAPLDPSLDDVVPATAMSPLMVAIEDKRVPVVRALIDAGADVNLATADGWTALHHAVDIECDIRNQTGEPPDHAIVELLLSAGANTRAVYRSPSGDQTPGDLARSYGWTEAAERLGS
jgi:ankyrin repeat protein